MATGSLDRITALFQVGLNDVLDKLEDPEKMARQHVRDLEAAVQRSVAALGTAIANQRRLEKAYQADGQRVGEWAEKAEMAMEDGDEAGARKALERKLVFERAVAQRKEAVEESQTTVTRIRAEVDEVKVQLKDIKARQDTLVARYQAAQARQQANEAAQMERRVASRHSVDPQAFERFEDEVNTTEAGAQVYGEMADEARQMERQIAAEEQETRIEAELAALREKSTKNA
jgi:phage shock protein A